MILSLGARELGLRGVFGRRKVGERLVAIRARGVEGGK